MSVREKIPASAPRPDASAVRPLDPATRGRMERGLGHDFSRVRVANHAAPESIRGKVMNVYKEALFTPVGATHPGVHLPGERSRADAARSPARFKFFDDPKRRAGWQAKLVPPGGTKPTPTTGAGGTK